MDNNIFKGFALILFGMLLCIGDEEVNSIFRSSPDFPFALLGVISGVVGLVMCLKKDKEEKKN